ncbi:hypothetical protein Fmac_017138 [Flemingia macrophylla]|uniref:MBD domain-containing protein n=1 Tax=Flemingia macrophylla TaxID=520843 RepID=A0ABD1M196_9FABA
MDAERSHMEPNAEEISELTKKTLEKINEIYPHSRIHSGTTFTYHDKNSPGYGWLLPGWVAEERRGKTGKIHRYYYDPRGRFYKTQKMVLDTFAEENGIIVLDT